MLGSESEKQHITRRSGPPYGQKTSIVPAKRLTRVRLISKSVSCVFKTEDEEIYPWLEGSGDGVGQGRRLGGGGT
jgi:hypothetical protein